MLIKMMTALGPVIASARPRDRWKFCLIAAALVALVLAAVLVFGGCIYTSSLQPLTGTLSVSTRPS